MVSNFEIASRSKTFTAYNLVHFIWRSAAMAAFGIPLGNLKSHFSPLLYNRFCKNSAMIATEKKKRIAFPELKLKLNVTLNLIYGINRKLIMSSVWVLLFI